MSKHGFLDIVLRRLHLFGIYWRENRSVQMYALGKVFTLYSSDWLFFYESVMISLSLKYIYVISNAGTGMTRKSCSMNESINSDRIVKPLPGISLRWYICWNPPLEMAYFSYLTGSDELAFWRLWYAAYAWAYCARTRYHCWWAYKFFHDGIRVQRKWKWRGYSLQLRGMIVYGSV